jgi:dihydrodipicolinate reductase
LRAARFLQGQSSGMYDMQDVLGLRKWMFSKSE